MMRPRQLDRAIKAACRHAKAVSLELNDSDVILEPGEYQKRLESIYNSSSNTRLSHRLRRLRRTEIPLTRGVGSV